MGMLLKLFTAITTLRDLNLLIFTIPTIEMWTFLGTMAALTGLAYTVSPPAAHARIAFSQDQAASVYSDSTGSEAVPVTPRLTQPNNKAFAEKAEVPASSPKRSEPINKYTIPSMGPSSEEALSKHLGFSYDRDLFVRS